VSDGCGGQLDCGTCDTGLQCGAVGVPNRCGTPLATSEAGACLNGEDDDGDGRVDCRDSDCAGDAGCVARACAAVELGSGGLPVAYEGSTSEAAPRFDSPCASGPDTSEAVHRFVPPHTGEYAISVHDQDRLEPLNPALHVLRGCEGERLACQPSLGSATGARLWLEEGQPVFLVVEGEGAQAGKYRLTVTEFVKAEAGRCSDGFDNDGDGMRDGADPECANACQPMTCEDVGYFCGAAPDGCGGMLECRRCPEESTCDAVFTGRCGTCIVDADLGDGTPGRYANSPWRYDVDARSTEYLLATHTWTAPSTGVYVISNAGSGPSSQLRVRSGGCNGQEVPRDGESDRYLLQAGEQLFITLLGDGARQGRSTSAFQLHITGFAPEEPGLCADRLDNDGDGLMDCQDDACALTPECAGAACADVSLGSALPTWGYSLGGLRYDFFQPSCGVHGRDEDVYLWTAPRDGEYVFHGSSEAYTIALQASCTAKPELACARRDAMPWGNHEQPVLVRPMKAGESVLIILEGSQNDAGWPTSRPGLVFVHERQPEVGHALCTDSRDNDGDMRTDADDPDCPNYNGW